MPISEPDSSGSSLAETGAQALVSTLAEAGVDTCVGNPGTSEMHFVSAIDEVAGLRPVLALHECVATGAADGFGRMARRPAVTLLHAGPGLLNGGSNLHNARRAGTPILNIVGDHATFHRELDSPLTTDLEGIAASCADRVVAARTVADLPADAARAVSLTGPGRVVSLLLPADVAWSQGPVRVAPVTPECRIPVSEDALGGAAAALRRQGAGTALILGGCALTPEALAAAAAICAATGARMLASNLVPRLLRGQGSFTPETIPYAVSAAVEFLKGFHTLILAGAPDPVAFFAYPGKPGLLARPDAQRIALAGPEDAADDALIQLADLIGARPVSPPALATVAEPGQGVITADALGRTIAAMMPAGAIVVDESVSSGLAVWHETARAAPHEILKNMGGSIGFGLPAAAGAAIACPDRKVICLEADGSGFYTAQALWTWAREELDILAVIFANRRYQILQGELRNVNAAPPGPRAAALLEIDRPETSWTMMAQSMGVASARAETMEDFNRLYAANVRRGQGPFLIEAML